MKRSARGFTIVSDRPNKRLASLREEASNDGVFYFSVDIKSERKTRQMKQTKYYRWVTPRNLASVFIRASLIEEPVGPLQTRMHAITTTALLSLPKSRANATENLLPKKCVFDVLRLAILRGIDLYYPNDEITNTSAKKIYLTSTIGADQLGYVEEVFNSSVIDNNKFHRCFAFQGSWKYIYDHYGGKKEEDEDEFTSDSTFEEIESESESSDSDTISFSESSDEETSESEETDVRLERALSTIDHIVDTLSQLTAIIEKYSDRR